MITSNFQVDGDIYSYADKFFCDSDDDKPSNADARDGLINGAILEETDTGKTYIFDKKANQWTEKAAGGGGGGGSTTLAGLTDVGISNPSDGQTLVYDAASSKWVNGSGGGGSYTLFAGTYSDNPEAITLETTCADLYTACSNGSVGIRYTDVDVTVTVFIRLFSSTPGPDGRYVFLTTDGYEARGAASDAPVFQMPY